MYTNPVGPIKVLNYTTIKSGIYKDSGSSFRKGTVEDNKYFQNLENYVQ